MPQTTTPYTSVSTWSLTDSKVSTSRSQRLSYKSGTPSLSPVTPSARIAYIKNMLKAIKDFKRPSNKTELRAFLGLANQQASFIPDLAHGKTHMKQTTSSQKAAHLTASDKTLQHHGPHNPANRRQQTTRAIICTDAKPDDSDKLSLVMCGSKSLRQTTPQ